MENFIFDYDFYSDLDDLCQKQGWEQDDVDDILSANKDLQVECCDLEPAFVLSADWITQYIEDERFSEFFIDEEISDIQKVLNKNIDFKKVNAEIPKMYYGNGKKHFFTRDEIIESIKRES